MGRNDPCIYILTNRSFDHLNLVKIGYSDNVDKRIKELNSSSAVPYSFKLYAYYNVSTSLADKKLHELIDIIDSNRRARETTAEGKERVREFFRFTALEAYTILEDIAKINGLEENLVLVESSEEDIKEDDEVTESRLVKRTTMPRLDWMMEQGILKPGDQICVISHPEEIATLIDGNHVEYKGEQMSALEFGKKITGWKAIQIYTTMRLVDQTKTLGELREEKMRELGMLK